MILFNSQLNTAAQEPGLGLISPPYPFSRQPFASIWSFGNHSGPLHMHLCTDITRELSVQSTSRMKMRNIISRLWPSRARRASGRVRVHSPTLGSHRGFGPREGPTYWVRPRGGSLHCGFGPGDATRHVFGRHFAPHSRGRKPWVRRNVRRRAHRAPHIHSRRPKSLRSLRSTDSAERRLRRNQTRDVDDPELKARKDVLPISTNELGKGLLGWMPDVGPAPICENGCLLLARWRRVFLA